MVLFTHNLKTRMHSSRMRTGRTVTVFRKLEEPPPENLEQTPPSKILEQTPPRKFGADTPREQTPPPPCEQNDRQV